MTRQIRQTIYTKRGPVVVRVERRGIPAEKPAHKIDARNSEPDLISCIPLRPIALQVRNMLKSGRFPRELWGM